MGKPTSLVSRKRVWYFRKRYPQDVAEKLGRAERVVSLKTGHYPTALERHAEEMLSFNAVLVSTRRANSALPSEGASAAVPEDNTLIDAHRVVERYIQERRRWRAQNREPSREELALNGVPNDALIDIEAEYDLEHASLIQLDNQNGRQRISQVSHQLAEKQRIALVSGSEFAQALYEQVRRALVELNDEERGSFLGTAPAPGFRLFSNQPVPSLTFSEAVEKFRTDVLAAGKATPRTRRKQQATLDFLERHFGSQTAIANISRQDAIEFRDLLSEAPANATKLFGGLPLRELVQARKAKKCGTMKHATQTNYLWMAERLLQWAVNEEHISKNPARGLEPKAEKVAPEDQRDPYSIEELNRIFRAPIFTGCMDDRWRFSRRGPHVFKRSRYWLPLLGLFTGMRAEEILQLTPDHIAVSKKGTTFFNLSRDMDLKTPGSRREVPMHPFLTEAGFQTFVAEKRAAGSILLFDDLPADEDGRRSSTWSKRYATFAKSVGVKADRNCFHSYRHTFKAAADAAAIPEEMKDRLQGWSGVHKSTGRRYGPGLAADLLAPWMEKIAFENLDLSHLKSK